MSIDTSIATLPRIETNRAKHGNRWTRPAIRRAIQEFTASSGRPPTAEEWMRPGDWPNYKTVRRLFGTWAAAVESATGRRPRRGIYVATSRHRKRGRYQRHRPYPSRLTDEQRAARIAETSLFFRCASLDAPLRTSKSGETRTWMGVLSSHDDWEDRLIETIDQRREIDAWVDAA